MEGITNNMSMLDDINLPHSLRRSIWLVRDEEEGYYYTADEVLDDKPQDIIFNMRSTLTAAYKSGESKYVCPFCGEPVGLKVRTNEGDFFPFFSHYQDSDDSCPLKTTNEIDPTRIVISSENQFKESILHQDMVTKLKEALELSQTFKDIEIDKVISTPEVTGYRRPSLYAIYNDETKVCLDALVSNPQIGLLVGRNAFYKMQKLFYLWVFPDFSTKNQRMCEKDILYMNRRNVFVFDSLDYYKKESNKRHLGNIEPNHIFAYEESVRQKRLMLNCYWQVPVVSGDGKVSISWNGPELVAFEDILFDKDSFEAYYHDSDQDFYHSYSQDKQLLIDEWMRIKKDRWKKIFDSIEKRKILYEQTLARKERRERLAYYYPLIESGEITLVPFQDKKTKLWGYRYNEFEVIPPIYYEARPFYMGYAWAKKMTYWGIIDYKGNRIHNFVYKELTELSQTLYKVVRKDIIELINYKGNNLGTFRALLPFTINQVRAKALDNWKWGSVNEQGETVIPNEYEEIGDFINGKAKAKKGDRLNYYYGYINELGETTIPFEYKILQDFVEGKAKAWKNGKWGYINEKGEEIVSFEFDELGDFVDGKAHAKVRIDNWFTTEGFINEKGEEIYNLKSLQNGLLVYISTLKRKCGLKKKDGDVLTELVFNQVEDFVGSNVKANKNGKWGVINEKGEVIIPFEYDAIENFADAKIKANKKNGWNNMWGVIDYKGETIIPFEYQEIENFVNGKAKAQKNLSIGYINEKGEEIFNYKPLSNGLIVYSSSFLHRCGLMKDSDNRITDLVFIIIDDFIDGKAKAMKDGKWGYINEKGEAIVPFEYDSIENFNDGKVRACKKKGQHDCWGYVNEIGEEIFEQTPLSNGMIAYFSAFENKCGLMNADKKIVTGLDYNRIADFVEGKLKVEKSGKWGVINEKGEVIIPFEFDALEDFADGKTKAMKKHGPHNFWGYINSEGEEIYSYRTLSNGLIVYSSSFTNRCGLMNSNKEYITGLDYNIIEDFVDGKAKAKQNNMWGYINKVGGIIVPFIYGGALEDFIDGKAKAKRKGKWGYVNEDGKEIIPCIYDALEDFVDGKAKANKKNGWLDNWSYINVNGEEIFDYRVLSNGLIKYSSAFQRKSGLMKSNKELITDLDYDYIDDFVNGKAKAEKKNKWGYVDENGEEIIPFEYASLENFIDGSAIAEKNNKWGVINENGETTIPFEYDKIIDSEGRYKLFKTYGYGWHKRIKVVKEIYLSNSKRNQIEITIIDKNKEYVATVTGRMHIGVFIKIPEIGNSLIPAKYLKKIGKSIKDYKKGMQVKVQLLSINKEKQQATFMIVEKTQ